MFVFIDMRRWIWARLLRLRGTWNNWRARRFVIRQLQAEIKEAGYIQAELRAEATQLKARIQELIRELEARPRNAESGEICCPHCQMVFMARNHELEAALIGNDVWRLYGCPACGGPFALPIPIEESKR